MGLICSRLSKAYAQGARTTHALADVSFSVADGEFVCVVGPSGCGKTTLLKILAGLLAPTTGALQFTTPPPADRPRSALVFQEHGLFPWLTVVDNVAFGLEARGVGRAERHARAQEFLAQFGLGAFARHYPDQLSIGMRQRVGLARAFLADPPLLLMDEPFAALDAQTKLVLQEELVRVWREHRKMVVYVTHDIEEAILLGDRVFVMTGRPGRIREEINIPLARPRALTARTGTELVEIKWHIWKMLEDEVRLSLAAG